MTVRFFKPLHLQKVIHQHDDQEQYGYPPVTSFDFCKFVGANGAQLAFGIDHHGTGGAFFLFHRTINVSLRLNML